jgi:AcrR family transcriptional regulator
MEVAERLFSQQGVEGVSLSEINRAADQGNNSALHYHFGSKEGLFEAIRERRREQIAHYAERRVMLLGADVTPQATYRAVIDGLDDWLRQEDGAGHFLRILAQWSGGRDLGSLNQIMEQVAPEPFVRVADRLSRQLPLTPDELNERITMVSDLVILTMSRRLVDVDLDPGQRREILDDLSNVVGAILEVPPLNASR